MTEFNIERLRSAVAWAEKEAAKAEDKRAWDQAAWMRGTRGTRVRRVSTIKFSGTYEEVPEASVVEVTCGTSYCVAGHVCADAGDRFAVYGWETPDENGRVHADMVIPKGSDTAYSVSLRAQELLGIETDEAVRLFEGFNRIEDIRTIAKDIAAAHGEEL